MRASAVIALSLAVAAAGCGRGRASAERGPKPVKAKLVTVEQKQLRRDIESVGSLLAYDEVAVSSEVEGKVERVLADIGDKVAQGQPLVKVVPVELELAAEQQRAAYQQTRARLGLDDGGEDLKDVADAAEVKRAAAALEDARQKYERSRSLYADGLVSRGDFDAVDANYKSAKASHDMARQSVENVRAELQQRRASMRLAEKKLQDAMIRAPFAGRVKERMATPGQYLKVQTPVMVIVNVDPLRVKLQVPEKVAAWIGVGQAVSVSVEAFPGRQFTGKVSRMSPSVDTQTRTLELEALLDNREGLLKPGFFVKARIASNHVESVLLVPNDAVRYVFGVYKVFKVEDGKAHEAEVKLGDKSGAEVEILEGLQDKQKIAVPIEGQELRDGVAVEPVA
jgi:RND family efflux transporter MFP subunit